MKVSLAATGLKKLRERAGMSVREVADALGRPASTYASYEDKFKKPYLPLELVHGLVPVFEPKGVPKAEILSLGGIEIAQVASSAENATIPGQDRLSTPSGERPVQDINIATMPMDLPILGSGVAGEDGLFDLNGQTIDYARRPPRLASVKDAYALYLNGSCMSPWRESGQKVYVHPHIMPQPGDYVVVQLRQEAAGGPFPAYIKRLVRRSATEVRLLQFNPREEKTIATRRIHAIHKILDWDELLGL